MKNKWNGYVIAKMLEDEGKIKPFTYYPSKKGGRPPFLFKNKSKAIKVMKSKRLEFYRSDDLKILKFKQPMYLDRF
jgi:hypothetical protein